MPYPGWDPGYWKLTPLVSIGSQPTPGLVIGGGIPFPGWDPGYWKVTPLVSQSRDQTMPEA